MKTIKYPITISPQPKIVRELKANIESLKMGEILQLETATELHTALSKRYLLGGISIQRAGDIVFVSKHYINNPT